MSTPLPPEPQQVLCLFNKLAGTRLSDLIPDVAAQAVSFVKQGFTLEDLEVTFLWIKREVAAGRNGLNECSSSWRCMFGRRGAGDEWLNFHDRLAKAREAQRKGWKPKLTTAAQEPPRLNPNVIPMPEQKGDFNAEKWAHSQAEREEFKRRLAGR